MKRLIYLKESLLTQLVEWTKPIYGFFFQKSKVPWDVTIKQLQVYPEGSLGKDLGIFLSEHNLTLMPKFESHDVYHVLLQYKTTVIDEAKMQFFLFGNGKSSMYIIGTNALAILFYPLHIKSFHDEYCKGKNARSIAKWQFEYLLREPTDLLRKMMNG